MGVRKTQLPAVPDPTPDNQLDVLRALKEIVEVGIRDIDRGDTLDAYVTFRDIRDGNTGQESNLEGSIIGTPANPGGSPPPGGPFPPPVPVDDLYLPGRPTNIRTQAVWDGIMVLWDWPDTSDPNVTWDRAAVHSSATPNHPDGDIVGYSATDFFIHNGIGLSDPTGDPDTVSPGVRYYWVRFEYNNPISGELDVTEWSPYEYQDGVRGETATDIALFIETFRLSSSEHPEYGSIAPFIVGEITSVNEDGEPITTLAVGLDGHFLVNGTITAQAIQAETIGAREIFAQSVWAGLMTANNVISSQFTTRARDPDAAGGDWRFEINGEGTTYESFPIWYGRGETGGDNGLFWIQRYLTPDDTYVSSMFLSGELYVTGIGKFFAGNILFDEEGRGEPDVRSMRIEIGGPATGYLLWAGSGLTGGDPLSDDPELESNPVFFIDNQGNAVFRGTVEAEFVSGEISRTSIFTKNWGAAGLKVKPVPTKETDISTMPETYWTVITDTWELPEPPFATGHIPHCEIGFLMYGDDALSGSTRVEYKNTPAGDWIPLHYSVHDIARYGGHRSLTVIVPERRDGKTWFRFSVAGFDNGGKREPPTINNINGLLMGIR